MIKGRDIPKREKRKSLFYKFEVLNNNEQLIGYLADINLNGLKVISKEALQLNSTHKLIIKLPERISDNSQITFDAKCVWCKEDSDNHQLGFKAHHENADNINTIKLIMELLATPEDLIL